MLIRPSALFLIAAIPRIAFAQPAPSNPPKPQGYDCVDMDGTGGVTANDFMAFQNAYAARMGYDAAIANQTPPAQPSGFTATANGTLVTLKWTNPGQPWGNGYVTRGTTVIPFTVNTTQVTDSPGPGSFVYSCTVRNIVTTGSYPGTYAPTAAAPTASATVQGTQPPPSQGWTSFAQDAGSRIVYVSSAGSGSTCSQANPCALSTGLTQLRNGTTDWLLLKSGDTFNIASQINVTVGGAGPGRPLVFGSYGTGARPTIACGPPGASSAGHGFNGDSIGKGHVAFVNLRIVGARAFDTAAIKMIGWNDVLVEGCDLSGFNRGIIAQGFNIQASGLTIRRNYIHDVDFNGSTTGQHAQGCYIDKTNGWVIEENFFERCGIVGSIFSRPVYLQTDCGRGIYRRNIMANNPAEGVQVRPGGTVTDNLSLRNPIGIYVGGDQAGTNEVAYNVCLESGDISTVDRRGVGLHVDSVCNVHHNIAAYNTGTGEGSVKGIKLNGATGTCSDNYVFGWTRTSGPGNVDESHGIHHENGGNLAMSGNRVYQTGKGIVFEKLGGSGSTTGTGNFYYQNPASAFTAFRPNATMAGWAPVSQPADPNLRALLPGGSIDAYAAKLRLQSKASWDDTLMADKVNATIRAAVGVAGPANP